MIPKFRVWDKRRNEMYSPDELTIQINGSEILIALASSMHQIFNYELMQSTGLKDKKGVEIYEGDIVKVIEDAIFGGTYLGVIEFIERLGVYGFSMHNANVLETRECRRNSIAFNSKMCGNRFTLTEAMYRENRFEIEVVGNAYANPELMEEMAE